MEIKRGAERPGESASSLARGDPVEFHLAAFFGVFHHHVTERRPAEEGRVLTLADEDRRPLRTTLAVNPDLLTLLETFDRHADNLAPAVESGPGHGSSGCKLAPSSPESGPGVAMSSRVSKRLFLIAAAAAAAVFLMGGCEFSCSTGSTVSAEELNRQVRDSYEDETGGKLTSIDCQAVDAEVGKPILCEATNESDIDLNITGTVTEYDSESDEIKFDWIVDSAMAPGENYAVAAQQALASQTGVQLTDIECPDRVLVKKGNELDCTAKDPNGDTRTITVTLTDDKGGFNANLHKLGD